MNDFYNDISVDKYVIMPDHIHLLLTIINGQSRTPDPFAVPEIKDFDRSTRLCLASSRTASARHCDPTNKSNRNSVVAKFVSTFKRFCNKEYGENIWQARYYDHVIRNQEDYNEAWEYTQNNPTKWIEMHK